MVRCQLCHGRADSQIGLVTAPKRRRLADAHRVAAYAESPPHRPTRPTLPRTHPIADTLRTPSATVWWQAWCRGYLRRSEYSYVCIRLYRSRIAPSVSQNPGYDTSATSAPSTRVSPVATSPATAQPIASRWSPWLASAAP